MSSFDCTPVLNFKLLYVIFPVTSTPEELYTLVVNFMVSLPKYLVDTGISDLVTTTLYPDGNVTDVILTTAHH